MASTVGGCFGGGGGGAGGGINKQGNIDDSDESCPICLQIFDADNVPVILGGVEVRKKNGDPF